MGPVPALLIGSAAIRYQIPGFRDPKDHDIWCSPNWAETIRNDSSFSENSYSPHKRKLGGDHGDLHLDITWSRPSSWMEWFLLANVGAEQITAGRLPITLARISSLHAISATLSEFNHPHRIKHEEAARFIEKYAGIDYNKSEIRGIEVGRTWFTRQYGRYK